MVRGGQRPARRPGRGNAGGLAAQLFAAALGQHQAGRLAEAQACYRRALEADPRHAPSLHYLGVLAYQQGQHASAADLIGQSISLDGDNPESRYNITLPLYALGRHADVIVHARRAIALKSDHALAHNNLGLALMAQGCAAEAVTHFQRAAALDPRLTEAYLNLADALLRHGKLHDALGVINHAFEAGAAQAKAAQALALVRRAIEMEESADTRTLFVQCVRSLARVPDLDFVRAFMMRALTEPWGRPADLAAAATSLIGTAPAIGDELLHALLRAAPVRDIALERFLTATRRDLLERRDEAWDAATLRFACALAAQCFINEYAFAVADTESAAVDLIEAALAHGDAPVQSLVMLAAYRPLHALPGAAMLGDRAWPEPVQALLDLAVRAPLQERQIADALPSLTAIGDGVSRQVQEQYEQSPYPRWLGIAPVGAATTIDRYLARFPGYCPLRKDTADVLIAGCGTGQHAATVALQFVNANILAIDLSRASLAYAQRMTRALGLTGIAYAQADILELGALDRDFDLIDSSGVLHHLADPFEGWRVLLTRLRPGGVMRLGFYSALGRRDIAAVRRFVTERDYRATPADIRRCRQDLMNAADGTPQKSVTGTSDFFSLSECRDLLFHVQEHCLTLPQIRDFLRAAGLTFLGFETGAAARAHYARRFPGDAAMADLDHWHAVETEEPHTFRAMYQFWVQARA